MPLNLKPGKHLYRKRIYPDSHTLHVHRKSETAIRYMYNCMYLKSPKCSKRFSSSLTRNIGIAFRMTVELFSFRKEVPNRWIITQNGTTKLGLFPDLIYTASLLGATGLLFTYQDKLNIAA